MEKEIRACVYCYLSLSIYGYSRVTWSSMFVDGSSYVSFSRSLRLCIHFVVYLVSEMSDFLLGALGHRPFHHYIRYWHDFPAYLIWADHHSFLFLVLHHHHPRFHSWFIVFILHFSFFLQWPTFGFDILFTLPLYISVSVWSVSFVSSSTLCSH